MKHWLLTGPQISYLQAGGPCIVRSEERHHHWAAPSNHTTLMFSPAAPQRIPFCGVPTTPPLPSGFPFVVFPQPRRSPADSLLWYFHNPAAHQRIPFCVISITPPLPSGFPSEVLPQPRRSPADSLL